MSLDPASLTRLRLVYPDISERVKKTFEEVKTTTGLSMRVTEGLRSWKRQEDLYAQGRTAPGSIVTWSKPGDSFHHYGFAVDACFQGTDPYLEHHHRGEMIWREYGRIARLNGLFWGGDWASSTDRPHVQMTYGMSLDRLKALYKEGGISAVWTEADRLRGAESADWYGPQASVRLLGSFDPSLLA